MNYHVFRIATRKSSSKTSSQHSLFYALKERPRFPFFLRRCFIWSSEFGFASGLRRLLRLSCLSQIFTACLCSFFQLFPNLDEIDLELSAYIFGLRTDAPCLDPGDGAVENIVGPAPDTSPRRSTLRNSGCIVRTYNFILRIFLSAIRKPAVSLSSSGI
ncbi:hypothetical protein BDR22DRAFT_574625 [Usnea florida]